MTGNSTMLSRPQSSKTGNAAEDEKNFSYDFSYWSFDGDDPNYASQKTVFDDLGTEVLKNAWEGFNTSIFAYGQTGAGKSYSMLGYGEDKGIIPLACEEMFRRIQDNDDPSVSFKIEVSFMEIYNEKVKDLLNPKNNKTGGLKVRNHPTTGPYVEDLAKLAVKSFNEVETLMDEGSKARTVASTNMNATSSRSHAVFTLVFTQSNAGGGGVAPSERASKIHLVDLAGSERASSTGAAGMRLKEGANINKSLSTLGKVISSLAENSSGKKQVFVPYRDSVLTWLLKESLGGNAKTIMIAAISPADINYDETLSTLRYADSAKKIKNTAVVNEDPKSKLIRELQQEVENLRKRLLEGGSDLRSISISSERGGGDEDGTDDNESGHHDQLVTSLREQLEQSEKLIAELNKSWEERLYDAQQVREERVAALKDMGVAIKAVAWLPHLVNLNEDPLMNGSLLYYLREGTTRVGRSLTAFEAEKHNSDLDKSTPDIVLNGLNIARDHCTFVCEIVEQKLRSEEDGEAEGEEEGEFGEEDRRMLRVTIVPPALDPNNQHSFIYVNGVEISMPFLLTHGNRVILGNNHAFRFNHPLEAARKAAELVQKGEHKDEVVDWDFALRELAAAQGKLMISRAHFDEKEKELEKKMREIFEEQARQISQQIRKSAEHEVDEHKMKLDDKQRRATTLAARRWVERVARRRLERNITQMILPINEANAISIALGRNVTFELKLHASFPAHLSEDQLAPISLALGGWRRTQLGVRITSSPPLNSSSAKTESALLSQEDFLDRFAVMREIYQTASFMPSSLQTNVLQAPFRVPVQPHILLAVGRLYLQTLLYLLDKNYLLPLIAADGTPRGHLTVELSPVNKGSGRRGADGEQLVEDLVSKKLEFVLKISKIIGMNPADYRDVFCKFSFAGVVYETSRCVNPTDMDYVSTITIEKVDDDMLQFLQTGAITIELYGIPHSQHLLSLTHSDNPVGDGLFESPFSEEEERTVEFIATIDVMEAQQAVEDAANVSLDKSYVSVPSIETEGGDVVFRLLEDCNEKRIIFRMVRSSTSIVECKSIYVGNIRPAQRNTKKSHSLLPNSAQNSPFVPPPPSISASKDWVSLPVRSVSKDIIVVDWNVGSYQQMRAFGERTRKGERLMFGFVAEVILDNDVQALQIAKDITVKILPSPPISHGGVLERLRNSGQGMVIGVQGGSAATSHSVAGGAPFRVAVRKTRSTSQLSRIVAMIDHHRQGLIKFGNALQLERLKQELDLREKLAVGTAHNSAEEDSDSLTRELAKRISSMEMSNNVNSYALPRKKSEANLLTMLEVQVGNVATSVLRQHERAGWLRKRSNYKNTWKRRWFTLRRPFLEYFESDAPKSEHTRGDSNERHRIDLTNCTITVLQEENNGDEQLMNGHDSSHSQGFMFAIMQGRGRGWILSAANEEERNAWLETLDPSRVVAASLQEKLKSAQNDSLKTKSLVEILQNQLQMSEERTREATEAVARLEREISDRMALLETLTEDLNSVKRTLSTSNQEKQNLEKQIARLHEDAQKVLRDADSVNQARHDRELEVNRLSEALDTANQSLTSTAQLLEEARRQGEVERQSLALELQEAREECNSRDNELDELRVKVGEQEVEIVSISQKADFVISNMSMKLSVLQKEVENKMQQIQSLSSTVGTSTKMMETTTGHMQSLLTQISGFKSDLQNKENTIRVVTTEKKQAEAQLKRAKLTGEQLRADSSKSQEEVTELKQELELTKTRLAQAMTEAYNLEGMMVHQSDKTRELEDQLRLKDAQIQVLEDHCQRVRQDFDSIAQTSKLQMSSKSSGFFGKKPTVESYREASIAHQTHNAFLHLELKRLDTEKQNQEKVYTDTIKRLKADVQAKSQQYNALLRGQVGVDPGTMIENLTGNLHVLRKKYFISLAVGGKLQRCLAVGHCNVDAYELYELAVDQHVVDIDLWPNWIADQLGKDS